MGYGECFTSLELVLVKKLKYTANSHSADYAWPLGSVINSLPTYQEVLSYIPSSSKVFFSSRELCYVMYGPGHQEN